MRVTENEMEMSVFEKDWGREVYFDTANEAIEFLNKKGLSFISEQLEDRIEKTIEYKEICISQLKNGYILEVGICGFGQFEYFPVYTQK